MTRRQTEQVSLADSPKLVIDNVTGPLFPYRICWFSLRAVVNDRHLCSHRYMLLPTHATALIGPELKQYVSDHIDESVQLGTCENVR